MNDTVVFEYNTDTDTISFSENISNYIPMQEQIDRFVQRINTVAKIHEEDVEKTIRFLTAQRQENIASMEYVRFLDVTGEFRWYQIKGMIPTHRAEDAPILCGTISYISDDKKQFDEERSLTKVAVTGLVTAETLVEQVNIYMENVPEDVKPALIVVEIDDYKGFVKTHGNISGEGIQIEVARLLRKTFRGSDVIGQLSEDRFAVFMKGVHSSGIVLERSRHVNETIKAMGNKFDDDRKITVSVGASVMDSYFASYDELYRRGLLALDDARSIGTDNYIIYAENMERMDASINPVLSTKEMELVRSILDPISTWAYVVDEDYQILYRNALMTKHITNKCEGFCYKQNYEGDGPCEDCPLSHIDEKVDSFDSAMYIKSLNASVPVRTTRIILRNGKSIYVIAAVNENIEDQVELLKESELRISDGLYKTQDIIWDINLTKNTCVRAKENNVGSVMDLRVKNFRRLVDYYVENIVYKEDITAFMELTDAAYLKRMIKTGRHSLSRVLRCKDVNNEYKWMGFYAYLPEYKDGEDIYVLISGVDIDEYKRASMDSFESKIKYEIMKEKSSILKDMALSYERHENVNEMIGILVYEYTAADKEYYLCSNFEDVFQVDKTALNDEWSIINMLEIHSEDKDIFDKFIETVKSSPLVQKVTVRIKNKFGVFVWYTVTIQALRGLENEVVRYLGTFQNVDTEMKIKGEMAYRADYDSLTDVYKAEAFYKKTSEVINLRTDTEFALFSIDIDKFRLINDSYGIEEGNKLLHIIGDVIKRVIPKDSYVKRYQADIFSVIFPYNEDQELIDFMTDFSAAANAASNVPTHISFTFGIYKIVDRELPIRLMCDRARAAKRQLKGSASASNYAVYDDAIRLKLREQAEIEERMEEALANREFVMFLQPQVDVKTRKIYGAEALVRWDNPTKGIMVPFQFMELFESNGFIVKLDRYMWEEACKYLRVLKDRGIDLPIAVNISRAHIGTTDLTKVFIDLVKKYDINPKNLELEITENLFMDDVHELFDQMSSLKQNGFSIHMDDFGSAYSSLNMLRNAPVDTLKIDKFFFDEIMTTERGRIIVESSVRMAKQLGLLTIAEGVERQEQLDFLAGIGCDIVQGYYFSRPVNIEGFEKFYEEYK
ncbi:MAG: GGDEF domain-containing phosphodiesterase [Lachnospiraceae bacterium]|nr:GGDEF domain-containing phosphodiesterase [Lachnospiraceae bacterium]